MRMASAGCRDEPTHERLLAVPRDLQPQSCYAMGRLATIAALRKRATPKTSDLAVAWPAGVVQTSVSPARLACFAR
jgi:hypothetical protein